MDIVEQCTILVNELMDGADRGDFSGEKIPEKYTYQHLYALFILSHYLDDGKKLYELIYDLTMKCDSANIHRKSVAGEKIKVAFVVISAAEWGAEQI